MKINICCITFNHAAYLRQTLDSFLSQKVNFDIEIVLADDFSTDGSREILLFYKEKYPDKIRLILQASNVGVRYNFLTALSACDGDYIAFCDGDDYWTNPHKLQLQIDLMERRPDVSLCFHNVWFQDGEKYALKKHVLKDHVYEIEDLSMGNFINTVSAVIRTSALDRKLIKDPSVVPCDYTLFMLVARAGSIYYFKKPMAVYRYHTTSSWSTQSDQEQMMKSVKVLDGLIGHFTDKINGLLSWYKEQLIDYVLITQLQDEEKLKQLYLTYFSDSDASSYATTLDKLKKKAIAHRKERHLGPISRVRKKLEALWTHGYLLFYKYEPKI